METLLTIKINPIRKKNASLNEKQININYKYNYKKMYFGNLKN